MLLEAGLGASGGAVVWGVWFLVLHPFEPWVGISGWLEKRPQKSSLKRGLGLPGVVTDSSFLILTYTRGKQFCVFLGSDFT